MKNGKFSATITITKIYKHFEPYQKNGNVGFEDIVIEVEFKEDIWFQLGETKMPIKQVKLECFSSLHQKSFMKQKYALYEEDIAYLNSVLLHKKFPCTVTTETYEDEENSKCLELTVSFTDNILGKIQGNCSCGPFVIKEEMIVS